jgi:hypothetical protein
MKQVSRIGVYLGVFLMVMALAIPGYAQETTGTIQGTVKDATGAVVPKAAVEISGPSLITTRTMNTDEAGFYRFTLLPGGVYTVTVTAAGFRQAKRTTIKLEVGRALPIDFGLEVGAVAATVEVQATPEIVDTTSSKAAVNLTADVIDNLPKGRSFTSMIALAPGARSEPLQAGFQLDGASDGENVYAFEGMDTTNVQTGGVGVQIPLDFIQEVNIKVSGFEAEYGGALGGVVNLVSKRGGNNWHGSGLVYYRSNAFQASDRPSLRLDPDTSHGAYNPSGGNTSTSRFSQPAQLFQAKEDKWRAIEPGFDIGGYVMKDRLWIYASYIPSLIRYGRTVDFYNATTGILLGPRNFVQTDNTLFGLGRLDWQATRTVRASASWQYAYRRFEGSLPNQDSVFGDGPQRNTSARTDPGLFRPDSGQALPNSTFAFTGEWTPTPRIVVTGRFGYWHTNIGQRGAPVGVRLVYETSAGAATPVMGAGTPAIPANLFNSQGSANMTSNRQSVFDVYNRHGLDLNASYFLRGMGTHTIKGGYAFNRLFNDVQVSNNTALVNIAWGAAYTANLAAGIAACTAITTANAAAYGTTPSGGAWGCRGLYGYYTVRDGTNVQGNVSSYNHSLYIQDNWSVGHGVTLNLGVRFDKERLPSYKSGTGIISQPIAFGFGDKFAPRLGGAWDVFRNGKLKVYGSWGYFYDIMKYELPRGSFGGDYWHDCIFMLDTTNIATIDPIMAGGHTCPSGGGNPGAFIENVDWRTVANSTADNRVAPDLKPMKQHEFVAGGEYSLRHNVGLDVRYSRKRLDHTIEDVGTFDGAVGENYYIANPGEGIVKFPLAIPGLPAFCPACPAGPKATRNYDGLEVRVQKRLSHGWYASASYTYSRLWGNYSGLTSTDESGRHSPNVNRYFDMPFMAFDSHGKAAMGLLPTDRPHTLKMFGSYRLKWWGMETTFGGNQVVYSGSPLTTEMSLISSLSSSHPIEGRGTFVNITRDPATGNWVLGTIERGKRTPKYTNSDVVVSHEFKLSKTNENLRAMVELNVLNLFNESNSLSVYQYPVHSSNRIISFGSDPVTASPNFAYFFAGYDYIAVANNPSIIPTVPAGTTGPVLDSRYGIPNRFQGPRSLRLKVKFTF